MAAIVFDNLKNAAKPSSFQKFTYTDLHLDLQEQNVQSGGAPSSVLGKDIMVDFDEQAIRNSIINIISTRRGERILLPEFGTNLEEYLFQPVSDIIANQIGRMIIAALTLWEPRVEVLDISVMGISDSHEYIVTMTIGIPFLKKETSIATTVSRSGFIEGRSNTAI